MKRIRNVLFLSALAFWLGTPQTLFADLNTIQVIDREMAKKVEELKECGGYSSEDFNACQITWTTRQLEKTDPYSSYDPHEVTLSYENHEIIKLVNEQDGTPESIQGLGMNCLEFNNYVYLFFDTLDAETRAKFGLPELAYVIYSRDQGNSWSKMMSLDPFSPKEKFVIPREKFDKYVKIFGNKDNHVLSIFNMLDETTYLFDPEFKVLKTVPFYNRLTRYDYPSDFYWYDNVLYLARNACEERRSTIRCPGYTYMETSKDFGKTWEKVKQPHLIKSYFLTIDDSLYQFFLMPCRSSWFGMLPAIDRYWRCGYLKMRKLQENGKWGKPQILLDTVDQLYGVYNDKNPVFVWKDYRFHKSRLCGFIPVVGCVDSAPVRGPTVIYAGELDTKDWKIHESIISYKEQHP